MINRTLHAITNRAQGFNTTTLIADPGFRAALETEVTRRLRAMLGLDITRDDYHVFAVLAAVASCPDIDESFQDPVRSYALGDYAPPAPRYSGGLAVPDAKGAPQCQLLPQDTPVPDRFTLTYVDQDFGAVQYGSSRVIVPVAVLDNLVYPRWPLSLGFSGGVQMTWGAGAQFTAQAYPFRFPYEVLAETLHQAPEKNALLEAHGLLDHFYLAPTAVKKVALVALALGLSNPAVYG